MYMIVKTGDTYAEIFSALSGVRLVFKLSILCTSPVDSEK